MKRCIILLCLIVLLVGCTKKQTAGVSKFVGARDTEGFSCDLEIYEDANKLFTDSELVIIGVVNNILPRFRKISKTKYFMLLKLILP